MVSEFLLDIVFGIVSAMFLLQPDISWSVDTSGFQYFMDIIRFAGYMFPWGTVAAITSIILSICVFRIIVSFVKTLWDLLPLL